MDAIPNFWKYTHLHMTYHDMYDIYTIKTRYSHDLYTISVIYTIYQLLVFATICVTI